MVVIHLNWSSHWMTELGKPSKKPGGGHPRWPPPMPQSTTLAVSQRSFSKFGSEQWRALRVIFVTYNIWSSSPLVISKRWRAAHICRPILYTAWYTIKCYSPSLTHDRVHIRWKLSNWLKEYLFQAYGEGCPLDQGPWSLDKAPAIQARRILQ